MRKLVIGMAMASTALASPAFARDGQWYVEVNGGPMIVEDIDATINNTTNSIGVDTKTGFDFGGIVGYDFGAFRLETEASYRSADISGFSSGSASLPSGATALRSGDLAGNGNYNALSFMLNGLFDFGDDDGLQGFAGAGIGVARANLQGDVTAAPQTAVLNDSDTGLAWQVLAGLRAPVTDNIDLGLRYRMFTAENVNLVDRRGRNLETSVRSHSLLATLTYNFGGAPAPVVAPPPPPPAAVVPPPPPAPPPPPPVVQCNKGPYIVFFEWDKSDITPEAATILNNAASAYANCGSASVMLAGHADASGAKTYNVGLSQRRNTSVTNYLAGRGVPTGRISSEAFGETQLRVPTADGVRELQNRRVEVTYGPGSGM